MTFNTALFIMLRISHLRNNAYPKASCLWNLTNSRAVHVFMMHVLWGRWWCMRLLFTQLKSLDTKVGSKIATSEQICSMNPSCVLKIVSYDTKSHLSLCSCINFANLEVLIARRSQQKCWHPIVNQLIMCCNNRWLIASLNWNMNLKWFLLVG